MIDSRISSAFLEAHGFPLENHLLVLGLMGSHSHGTYIPPSEPDAIDDVDLMGFLVPPLEFHVGLPRWQHWVFKRDELDVVIYSLDKAFRLLLKSNPNILGLLWLREQEYVHHNPLFERLRAARSIFSSRAAAQAFSGYALDQLRRMQAFDLARMEEYETLSAQIRASVDLLEVLEGDASKLRHLASATALPMDTLSRFRKLHWEHFSGYMGEKRKAMVRKYQYDVKNAAHLIRLLRMGIEFLRTGQLHVHRTADAEELKAIKQGAWSLAQVKTEAEHLFGQIEEAQTSSPLPGQPDQQAANRLLVELHRAALGV